MALLPELGCLANLLEQSRSGVLFPATTAGLVGPMLKDLVSAQGIRRIGIFMNVIAALSSARDTRLLTTASYLPDPSGFMSAGINEALASQIGRAHVCTPITTAHS